MGIKAPYPPSPYPPTGRYESLKTANPNYDLSVLAHRSLNPKHHLALQYLNPGEDPVQSNMELHSRALYLIPSL